MFRRLKDNLHRQGQALRVLRDLLEEEFSYLLAGEPEKVSAVEFSIQELVRQLVDERASLRRLIRRIKPAARLSDILPELSADQAEPLAALLKLIDDGEQACAMKAAQNHMLANALHEQSRRLIDFMRSELTPRRHDAYGASGRFVGSRNESTLFRGRF